MPIYEYQCSSCQKIHEVMQKFSDEPMKTCPECDAPVAKIMSMTSFALKGTGWYATDYKKSGKKPVDSPSASASASASASSTSAPASTSTSGTASSSSSNSWSNSSSNSSGTSSASASPAAASAAPASASSPSKKSES